MMDDEAPVEPEDPFEGLPAFAQIMSAKRDEQHRAYREAAADPGYAERLVEAATSYCDTVAFQVGQLVQWKPRMRNRPYPVESVPVVVMRLLDPPVSVDVDGENLVEAYDLLVGFLDGEQTFRLTQVPAARFQLYIR